MSHASVMAAELDAQVGEFRSCRLYKGPYALVTTDALVLVLREGGRVVHAHALVVTGLNADGTGRSGAASPSSRSSPTATS